MNTVLLFLLALAIVPEFTSDAQLKKPANYREWVYLSSGLGMTYADASAAPNPNPNFGNVFAEPSAYRKFLETGHWPDKTMLVLEVRRSESKGSINNGGHYQGDVTSVEVAVKDTARFADQWGYFGFSGSATTAKRFSESSGCNACHSKNAAIENTFVQFYPTLLEVARAKGTLKPSYSASETAH